MSKRDKQKDVRNKNRKVFRKINLGIEQDLPKNFQGLQEEAQDKYQRKRIRRQIVGEFAKLRSTKDIPNPDDVRNFLVKHLGNIELARDSLQPEKNATNPWSQEIWRLLILDNDKLKDELAQVLEERAFAIEATKMRIRHKLQGLLKINVPTTIDGPNFDHVNVKNVHREIINIAGSDIVDFDIKGDFPIKSPGKYNISLGFGHGEPLVITLLIVIEPDEIPDDLKDLFEHTDIIPLTSEDSIQSQMKNVLLQGRNQDNEGRAYTIKLLKTAYISGYGKTIDTQRLLQRWRAEEQASKIAVNIVDTFEFAGQPHNKSLSKDEIEKMKILDLPPLVSHDLINATVDIDSLQRLFAFPQFRHLRGVDVENFSNEDIRLLSPATYWSITALKAGRDERRFRRLPPVDSRALAKILLSIARLQFDRLPIGTSESDIRFCLSGYCTRLGEYLVQQHGRYDFARDFFLEAISLNITNPKWDVTFPTVLLFRSFPNDDRVPSYFHSRGISRSPGEFLQLLDEPRWQKIEVYQTAARSFLELGTRHFQWASRWFDECSSKTKKELLNLIQSRLGMSGLTDFPDCVRVFRQEMDRFRTLLRQMMGSSSIHGIVQLRKQFEEVVKELDFLLSPTNREISNVLIQASESAERFLQSKTYEDQRNSADTTINSLERILNYGADNYTALWAEYLGAIAEQWRNLVSKEIEAIAKNIAPFLEVSLAEEYISLTNDHDGNRVPRAIFGVKNSGSGQATGINIQFCTPNGTSYFGQKQKMLLRSNESFEDYIQFEQELNMAPIELGYKASFYDPDRQLIEFESVQPLKILPMANVPELDVLVKSNPFRTDHEVDDEKMFVGRDQLLEEVNAYAIDQPRGSLLMLHGQRRVGKSSLLLFMEREIDKTEDSKQTLGVRVSWLEYAAHSAPDLLSEISYAIRLKFQKMYKQNLDIPERQEFRQSYSLAFNDLLRCLQAAGIRRLVLMWDEFDGLVNHLDAPALGYDRIFFEYLRGLSKRKDVTLVLTGGELMPILFEHWGEVFNHDRTWRIAYLLPTDGSVEKLVRNAYVKDILSFSDDAIEMIKKYSACNPFFIQMICKELVVAAQAQKSSYVCKLDVEEVVKWLVQQGLDAKYVRHLYTPRLKPDPLDMAIIGVMSEEELSHGYLEYVPQQTILRRIIKRDEDEVINRIGELVRREILQRNPDNNLEFRMMLPLFRDWFYDNHPEYQLWAPLLRR